MSAAGLTTGPFPRSPLAGPNLLRFRGTRLARATGVTATSVKPRTATRRGVLGSTGREPMRTRRGPPKSPTGACTPPPKFWRCFHGFLSPKPTNIASPLRSQTTKIQLSTVDHSARGSMKTAANCVS